MKETSLASQFCSYNVNLKLKELGFDEQCFAHYRDMKENMLVACNQGIAGVSYFELSDPENILLAALWQQAVEWIMNNYHIHVSIFELDFNMKERELLSVLSVLKHI